jgi:hypothetical protein
MKSFSIICFALLWTLIVSCNRYKPVTEFVSSNDLVGIWRLTAESRDFLKSEQICCPGEPTQLTLRVDKTFQLENAPDCWWQDSESCKGALSFDGTWEVLVQGESDDSVWIALKAITDGKENTHLVPLRQDKERHLISFGFGDPDRGRAIYLSKN